MITKIKQFLQKPFPQEESKLQLIKLITAISVFVVIFLYLFKPFGLHLIQTNLLLYCLGFGFASFVASMFYEFVIVPVLKIKSEGKSFTFGRWIIYFCGVIFFISLANFLFVRLVYFDHIVWSLFPYMLRSVFAIGLFPAVVIGGFALYRQELKYQNIADEVNLQETKVANVDLESDSRIFGIQKSSIRYIEAMQNYIKVGYVTADGEFNEQIERETLKNILVSSKGYLVRCHRSFLVNRDAILSTTGNAQGLLLSLSDCNKEIPVSRSYVSVFRDKSSK